MSYVIKAELATDSKARSLSFHEKTMYRGKDVRIHDEIFIFASENQGGQGLIARGIVTSVEPGPGIRVSITVRRTATAVRRLGRAELKPFRERLDTKPQTEIARKLYRQATNKIAGISASAAAFLDSHF